jgi:uncharacterized iron-regulated protein
VLAQSGAPSERVYISAKKQFTNIERLASDAARADVLFVGEEHDNVATHQAELALLQALARQRGDIVLALEMFERDVQEPLAHFLLGHTTEEEFLAVARPWPQYARDYKPLVDFAIARQWSVVAANVPRSLAAEVSKFGLGALLGRPPSELPWFAQQIKCSTGDEYFKRFRAAMGGESHAAGSGEGGIDAATMERYYQSQCLKDETMGESVAQAYAAAAVGGRHPLVVSFNGSFHSDFRDGTVARAHRRLSGKRILVVSILPVLDPVRFAPNDTDRKRADYLVLTAREGRN